MCVFVYVYVYLFIFQLCSIDSQELQISSPTMGYSSLRGPGLQGCQGCRFPWLPGPSSARLAGAHVTQLPGGACSPPRDANWQWWTAQKRERREERN